jgi:hypothetical protein
MAFETRTAISPRPRLGQELTFAEHAGALSDTRDGPTLPISPSKSRRYPFH